MSRFKRRERKEPGGATGEATPKAKRDLSGMATPKGGAPVVHGAYSKETRRRYSDLRSREGKKLETVTKALIEDLGGADNMTAGQCLLLDRVREKLIVLWQIGKFVDDRQGSVLDENGALLPCLGRNYVSYSEALRRDVQELYNQACKKPSKVPTLKDIIEAHDKGNTQ